MKIQNRRFAALVRSFSSRFALLGLCCAIGLLAQGNSPRESGRFVVSVVTAAGFQPRAATVTQGQVEFMFINRSGDRNLTFRYERQAGQSAPRELVERRPKLPAKSKARNLLNLAPATYIVTVEEHPSWIFTLDVEP